MYPRCYIFPEPSTAVYLIIISWCWDVINMILMLVLSFCT